LAAQSRLDAAQTALGRANLAYASAKADYDAALSRADLVRALRQRAGTTADASRRALAMLVRGLFQQSGTATVDVLLDGNAEDNLLYQLGTLDTLSRLTTNLDEVRSRVAADTKREQALEAQDATAQTVVAQIPVAEARAALEAAQSDVDAASAALATLVAAPPAASAPAASALRPLPAVLDTGRLSAQGWVRPAVGRITDSFGPRLTHPVAGVGDFHHGTDIGAGCNAAVYATTDGVVEAAGALGSYGNWILIGHGNGLETGYAHIANGETLVTVGDAVVAGQVIAGVGSTGASTGCHLHFEVRIDGTAIDAVPFLTQRGVNLGN